MTSDQDAQVLTGPPSDDGLPRLRLDELLRELVSRAGEVLTARDALRKLLAANRAISSELSLPEVLRLVVEAACDLANARYGALGVIGADGRLEQFIHTGIAPGEVERIGHLPGGDGLLGAVIAEARPIRSADLGADARSVGFPAHHPPMRSFLGVPILMREAVFGNLYLTESLAGEFTDEDTELVVALASTAAVAIENARLFHDSERRHQWMQASAEITERLLVSRSEEDAFRSITVQVRELADADAVSLVLPDGPTMLRVVAASGSAVERVVGNAYPRAGTLSEIAMDSGQPVRLAHSDDARAPLVQLKSILPVGPVMALPLIGRGHTSGALVICRLQGRTAFSLAELDMAATFAGHAAVALELAAARQAGARLALLEDRDRIARDLHDHVIQRLFGAGLTVQSVAATADPAVADRLDRVVDDIDDTIKQIRTTIFGLQARDGDRSVRRRVLELAAEMTERCGTAPEVRFGGPLDTAVPDDIADELIAVLREALSNVARHAHADSVQIELTVGDEVVLQVRDNGVGIGEPTHRSGLANLQARAEVRGGRFLAERTSTPGTRLEWAVPLG